MRFAHGLENGFLVQGPDAAQVDHLGLDVVFGGEQFGCFERGEHRAAVGD